MCERCMKCGRELTPDEVGLHKKLVNRASDRFLCMECLSKHFDIPIEGLRAMIERFRSQGCTLFN